MNNEERARANAEFSRALDEAARDPKRNGFWVALWCERFGRSLRDVMNELGVSEAEAFTFMVMLAPRRGLHRKDLHTIAGQIRVAPVLIARIIYLCEPLKPPLPQKKERSRKQYP